MTKRKVREQKVVHKKSRRTQRTRKIHWSGSTVFLMKISELFLIKVTAKRKRKVSPVLMHMCV